MTSSRVTPIWLANPPANPLDDVANPHANGTANPHANGPQTLQTPRTANPPYPPRARGFLLRAGDPRPAFAALALRCAASLRPRKQTPRNDDAHHTHDDDTTPHPSAEPFRTPFPNTTAQEAPRASTRPFIAKPLPSRCGKSARAFTSAAKKSSAQRAGVCTVKATDSVVDNRRFGELFKTACRARCRLHKAENNNGGR
jgi:hypothetical protein